MTMNYGHACSGSNINKNAWFILSCQSNRLKVGERAACVGTGFVEINTLQTDITYFYCCVMNN